MKFKQSHWSWTRQLVRGTEPTKRYKNQRSAHLNTQESSKKTTNVENLVQRIGYFQEVHLHWPLLTIPSWLWNRKRIIHYCFKSQWPTHVTNILFFCCEKKYQNNSRRKQLVLALSFRGIQFIMVGKVWQQDTISAWSPRNRGVKFHSYTGWAEKSHFTPHRKQRGHISPHTGNRELELKTVLRYKTSKLPSHPLRYPNPQPTPLPPIRYFHQQGCAS